MQQLLPRIKQAKEYSTESDAHFILLGTKLDLALSRQVTREEATKFALVNGLSHYFEISSATGENIEEAMSMICDILVAKLQCYDKAIKQQCIGELPNKMKINSWFS